MEKIKLLENVRILREDGLIDKEVRRTAILKIREFSNTNVHSPGTSVEEEKENIIEQMRDARKKSNVSNGGDDSDVSDLESLDTDDSDVSEECDVSDGSYETCSDSDMENSDPCLDEFLHTRFSVYPNGCDISTETRVCLKCRASPYLMSLKFIPDFKFTRFELTCVVNIVDVEGCKRFPQSFTYIQTDMRRFIPEYDYISRDFLLTAADELLPDDTLTLQVDVVLTASLANCFSHNDLIKSFRMKKRNVYLSLNCPLAEHLCAESRYFERLCATPMSEKDSGYAKIPIEEFFLFIQMVIILYDQVTLGHRGFTLVFGFQTILHTYRLADFDGIDRLLDTCRRWLKLVCHTNEEASAISDLADQYGDQILRGIVERAGSKNEDGTELVQDGIPYEPWTVDIKSDSEGSIEYIFHFSSKIEEEEGRVGHVTEDVSYVSNCYI